MLLTQLTSIAAPSVEGREEAGRWTLRERHTRLYGRLSLGSIHDVTKQDPAQSRGKIASMRSNAAASRIEVWVVKKLAQPRLASHLGSPQLSSRHHDHPNTSAMASPIPSMGALRALRQSIQPQVRQTTQVRHATLLKRPKRPYTFTQLITLSDGSSFTLRTTNPQPVYKSAKDIRNAPLWNPSSQKLLNVEEDEAGRLAAFRAKFGRGWDTDAEKVRTVKRVILQAY